MENMASVLETLKEVEDRAASSLGVEQVFRYRLPTARQQLQANITLLNDLERRWEHFVEHGFPRETDHGI
jgi:hypothetical protein